MTKKHVFCDILKTRDCQTLWKAVVHQALADAIDQSPKNALYQKNAQVWIEWGGKAFYMACDFAGYEPKNVREKFKLFMQKREKLQRK